MTLPSTRPARMVHQSARTGNRDYFAQPVEPAGFADEPRTITITPRDLGAFAGFLLCIAAVVIAIGSYAS